MSTTVQLGFTVDIVGYSTRTIPRQERAQNRLQAILDKVIDDTGMVIDGRYFQATGDGFNVFLPPTADVHLALRHLLFTVPTVLAEDNRGQDDRLRLRMAVDIGTVSPGPLGPVADAVIHFCRLVDSEPIRHAIAEHINANIAILVSDTVHRMIVSRFDDLDALPFMPVDIEAKNYKFPAHLYVPKA